MTLPRRFVISQLDEAAFKTGGLRDYSAYRDLGVAEVTRGLAHAHVIRLIMPFRLELSVRHHSQRAVPDGLLPEGLVRD